jgi:hypothetical protein
MAKRPQYVRSTDSATMIEIAPERFVNMWSAQALGLISGLEYEAASRTRKTEERP